MFTEKQLETIMELQKQVYKTRDIMKELGMTKGEYENCMRKGYRAGSIPDHVYKYNWMDARREKLKAIHHKHSINELAGKMGVHRQTIVNDLIVMGLYRTSVMDEENQTIEERLKRISEYNKNRLRRISAETKVDDVKLNNTGTVPVKLKSNRIRFRDINPKNFNDFKDIDMEIVERYDHFVLFKHIKSGRKESFLNTDINEMLTSGEMKEI